MGILDSLLGGGSNAGGSPLESIVMSMLANQGGQQGQQGGIGGMLGGLLGGGNAASGVQGLVSAFEQNGMGHIAQSWVGNGPNHPVSPDQVQQVFGDDQVQSISNQTGVPKQDLLSQLAQMLPGMVDRLTPQGQVPPTHI